MTIRDNVAFFGSQIRKKELISARACGILEMCSYARPDGAISGERGLSFWRATVAMSRAGRESWDLASGWFLICSRCEDGAPDHQWRTQEGKQPSGHRLSLSFMQFDSVWRMVKSGARKSQGNDSKRLVLWNLPSPTIIRRNGEESNEASEARVMKRLLAYMWRYKWLTALAPSLYFDQSFIDGNPLAARWYIDHLIRSNK